MTCLCYLYIVHYTFTLFDDSPPYQIQHFCICDCIQIQITPGPFFFLLFYFFRLHFILLGTSFRNVWTSHLSW
jgi:hypothetical protein